MNTILRAPHPGRLRGAMASGHEGTRRFLAEISATTDQSRRRRDRIGPTRSGPMDLGVKPNCPPTGLITRGPGVTAIGRPEWIRLRPTPSPPHSARRCRPDVPRSACDQPSGSHTQGTFPDQFDRYIGLATGNDRGSRWLARDADETGIVHGVPAIVVGLGIGPESTCSRSASPRATLPGRSPPATSPRHLPTKTSWTSRLGSIHMRYASERIPHIETHFVAS